MMVFPSMLVSACDEEKIPCPSVEELRNNEEDWDEFRESYPRFFIFCILQLCRPLVSWGEHWENAKVLGRLTDEQAKEMTLKDFRQRGFVGI